MLELIDRIRFISFLLVLVLCLISLGGMVYAVFTKDFAQAGMFIVAAVISGGGALALYVEPDNKNGKAKPAEEKRT